eukprot:347513_1
MQIHIKTITSNTFTLDVHPTNTVRDIKQKIQDREGIPVPVQRLIFDEKLLENDLLLLVYDIKHYSTVYLVCRFLTVHDKHQHDNVNKVQKYSCGVYSTFWDPNDFYYIKPKYKDIYQELTSNSVFKLKQKQIDDMTEKVLKRADNVRDLKAKKRNKWNHLCGIAPNTVISMDHMIAITASIHIDELYKQYMIVLRSNNKKQKSEIAHFSRLITESIKLYGTHMNKTFYQGVDRQMLFESFNCTTYGLVSFTPNIQIAEYFSGTDGMVIELTGCDSKGPLVLSVAPFSDYSEQEHRMITDTMCINNLTNMSSGLDYKVYFQAFQLWEKIIKGSFLINNQCQSIINKKSHNLIIKLLDSYLNGINYVSSNNTTTEHIHQIMQPLTRNVKHVIKNPNKISAILDCCIEKIEYDCIPTYVHQLFNEMMKNKKYILNMKKNKQKLIKSHFSSNKSKQQQLLEKSGIKVFDLPYVFWTIKGWMEYKKFLNGYVIKGPQIHATVNHLVDNNHDVVTFVPYCNLNKNNDTFEFELKLTNKLSFIDVEYEYEIFIKSIPFYFVC